MKKNLLFITVIIFFIAGCCNEEKCREKFPCQDPTEARCREIYPCPSNNSCNCTPGSVMKPVDQALAMEYIERYKRSGENKYGMVIDQCQICLVSGQAAQGLSIYIGKKSDATDKDAYIILAKYVTTTAEAKWADVTDTSDPGGTTCPPGTKCS